MTLLLSVPEFLGQHPDVAARTDTLRSHWKVPLVDPSGRSHGYRQEVNLRPGLNLLIDDYTLAEDLVVESETDEICEPCLELEMSFMLSGRNHEEEVQSHHNFAEASWDDEPGSASYWQAGERILKLDIHIESPLLATLVEEDSDSLPDSFQQLIQAFEPCQAHFRQVSLTTAAMQSAIHHILHCPYEGVTRWLYLESKVLEIIALRLEQVKQHQPPAASRGLKSDDIERIYYARDILHRQLVTPPTLQELSRLAGLNDFKLKKGFRQIFGTTVFGYITQQRMERACLLLAQQQAVTAVAGAVGYASPTAFSGAFQRRFGMSPKGYQVARRGG